MHFEAVRNDRRTGQTPFASHLVGLPAELVDSARESKPDCLSTKTQREQDRVDTRSPDFAEVIGRLEALLQPSQPCLRLRNILLPLDFTESSLRPLPFASFFAHQFGCNILLLHVVHLHIVGEERGVPLTRFLEEMKSVAERTLQEIALPWEFATTKVVVRAGSPAEQILREAAEADIDLILLGRHRRKGIWEFFSPSVGKKIISRAPCPTLVVTQN